MSKITVKTGSSAVSLTGGSDVDFTMTSQTAKGFTLAALADAYNLRRKMVFTRTEPKVSSSAPGGYTQQRSSGLVVTPITLANGNTTTNTASYNLAFDPESSVAQKLEQRLVLVQMIMDSELDAFNVDGSISL
jgi:hypothetical protein